MQFLGFMIFALAVAFALLILGTAVEFITASRFSIRRFYFKEKESDMSNEDVERSNENVRRQWRDAPNSTDSPQMEALSMWKFKHHVYASIDFGTSNDGYKMLKEGILQGRVSSWKVIDPMGREISLVEFCDEVADALSARSLVSQEA